MRGERSSEPQKSVFISYAHEDKRWVDELLTHLKPWVKDRRVNVWSDRDIGPGTLWRTEIEQALEEAAVSVMIVTPSLLASDFVVDEEMPRILERSAQGTTRLVWIAAEPSAVEATSLAAYQAVNDPSRPLSTLSRPDRQRALNGIAKAIATSTALDTLASSLTIVDETYEPLEAMVERRPELPDRSYRVEAEYLPAKQEIAFTGGYQSIRYEDLSTLAPEDHEFIQDLEESLRTNYGRWRAIRKGVGSAGGALDAEMQEQMKRITSLICADLSDILAFLRKIHNYELEDHYGRYRFLCSKLESV
jgi:hypothetical protein